jgi:hypothetical protein
VTWKAAKNFRFFPSAGMREGKKFINGHKKSTCTEDFHLFCSVFALQVNDWAESYLVKTHQQNSDRRDSSILMSVKNGRIPKFNGDEKFGFVIKNECPYARVLGYIVLNSHFGKENQQWKIYMQIYSTRSPWYLKIKKKKSGKTTKANTI